MNEDKDKVLALINNARAADILYQQFKPLFDGKKKAVLDKLLINFRTGNKTQDSLLSGVAAYNAIVELEAEILKTIRRGNDAGKKLTEERNDNSDSTA